MIKEMIINNLIEYANPTYTIRKYDSLNQIQNYTTLRKCKNADGQVVDAQSTKIRLRYIYPKEMDRQLSENGFDIPHIYKAWNRIPISNDNQEMIYVYKKAINIECCMKRKYKFSACGVDRTSCWRNSPSKKTGDAHWTYGDIPDK